MIRSTHIALVSQSLAFSLAFSLAGLAVALSPRTAMAQDQAAVDRLVQMNKKALDDYDTLDWDAAKRILLDALVAGKKAGLDNHPVMGRTYIHLGAVYITGFKDRQKGMQSFSRALEIDPTIQLSKGIETSEVTAAFAEAQRNARGGVGSSAGGGGGDDDNAPPPPKKKRRGPVMEGDAASDDHPKPKKRHPSGDEEPDLPAHVGALDCPEPDEAIIDKPLTVRCVVAPSLPVASVYLMYRAPDKEEYNEVLMTKSPKGWLQAKIPKKAVTGKSVQFYFEGRNAAGKPVVANGGSDSPNIVLVVEEEAKGEASTVPVGEEDENPLEDNEGNQRPRLHLGHVDKEREGLDTRYGKRRWWIGIGVGTGYGYAKGNGFEAVNRSNPNDQFHSLQSQFTPGLAWAGIGQLEPEIGYAFSPGMALAVTGRLQYTAPAAKYADFTYKGAIGVMAKLLFYTKQSQLRFYLGPLAGGGNFRFLGYPDTGATNGYSDFKDTIVAGPLLVGAAGGLYYEAAKSVSLVIELNEIIGLPTFGAVTDVNFAVQFNIYSTPAPKPAAGLTGPDQEEPK
ncbi:MAG TPA: hypothetical protein VLC06_27280 [Polyangia bacterium]|nr:hypothetical protein [Polyangia bacterium]